MMAVPPPVLSMAPRPCHAMFNPGHATCDALQRADGTISPLNFTLLWPYHAGLRAKLALQRRVSSEPSFSQVGGQGCTGSGAGAGKAAIAEKAAGAALKVVSIVEQTSSCRPAARLGVQQVPGGQKLPPTATALCCSIPINRRSLMTTTSVLGPASRSWCPR